MQVGQVSTPAANVAQHLQKTTEAVKMETITTLLLEENQLSESSGHAMPLTIVFVERKARCDEVQPVPATSCCLSPLLEDHMTGQHRACGGSANVDPSILAISTGTGHIYRPYVASPFSD